MVVVKSVDGTSEVGPQVCHLCAKCDWYVLDGGVLLEDVVPLDLVPELKVVDLGGVVGWGVCRG